MAFKLLHLLPLVITSQLLQTITCRCYNQPLKAISSLSKYGKWGVGPRPKITAMSDFDINKFYGGQWYTLAHYSDDGLLGRHCTKVQFTDANPGEDTCRIMANRSTINYDDGTNTPAVYFYIMPNASDHSAWIGTFHDSPVVSYVLDTDYDTYHVYHECREYPRCNPFLYEQNNYISSRRAVWPDGFKSFETVLDLYESLGIDTDPFVWHKQDDCPL